GQSEAAERAMRTRQPVLAGPIDLVQGGRALAMRHAIYVQDHSGDPDRFWGLTAVLVDFDALLREAQLAPEMNGVRMAVPGNDGLGGRGAVFFGDPTVFGAGGRVLDISFPGGSWQIAGRPIEGWAALRPDGLIVRAAGLLATLLAGFGGWLGLAYHVSLRR